MPATSTSVRAGEVTVIPSITLNSSSSKGATRWKETPGLRLQDLPETETWTGRWGSARSIPRIDNALR